MQKIKTARENGKIHPDKDLEEILSVQLIKKFTTDEHATFVRLSRKYGKNRRCQTLFIPGRNYDSVRAHTRLLIKRLKKAKEKGIKHPEADLEEIWVTDEHRPHQWNFNAKTQLITAIEKFGNDY